MYRPCSCNTQRIVVGPDRIVVNLSWRNYFDRAGDALRTRPCSEAVTQAEILRPSYEEEVCDKCRKEICNLSEFSRHLGEEVDKVVSKVRALPSFFSDIRTNLVFVEVPLDLPFWPRESTVPV